MAAPPAPSLEPSNGTFQHLGLSLRRSPNPATDDNSASAASNEGGTANQTIDTLSITNIEVQTASLLAAKAHILASGSVPPSLPTLFATDDVIEAARSVAVSSAAAAKEDKKPLLPDIIPGFKSSALDFRHTERSPCIKPIVNLSGRKALPLVAVIGPHRSICWLQANKPHPSRLHQLPSTAILPKAEEAFRTFHYVPYSALTTAPRVKADRGDEEFTISTTGTITAKGLDRWSEKAISMVDWLAASKAAAECTRFHWGDARVDALSAHSSLVMKLARSHGWEVAMEYDIQQREAAAHNPTHDLAMLNTTALTLIATRIALKPTAVFPPSTPHMQPSPVLKQPAATDLSQLPFHKQTRPDHIICFRCGLAGHLPADCKAEHTMAGKPVAAIVSSSKEENSLVTPSGKQFCFSWARASSCKFASSCYNVHACSICSDLAHRATSCKNSR
ncbi:hypothetical protein K439DRAFT_1623154 [Ramaria rubella]|nr:hypothetical protein K439DRAFT_1623154 [Ramaria rubella]